MDAVNYFMYEKADGELIVLDAIANMDEEQLSKFLEEQGNLVDNS